MQEGERRWPRRTPAVLHLSLVVGGELRDAAGERLGRVDDLIVRLGDEDYPPVTGVVATVAARPVFVAAEQIVEIAARLRHADRGSSSISSTSSGGRRRCC